MTEFLNQDVLDRVLEPVVSGLTEDVAKRIVGLGIETQIREQLKQLSAIQKERTLTEAEHREFLSILASLRLINRLEEKVRVGLTPQTTSSECDDTFAVAPADSPSSDVGHRQAQDIDWMLTMLHDGEFTQYEGQYIVVYEQAVVGHGEHPIEVKRVAAEKLGLHTGELLLQYVEPR